MGGWKFDCENNDAESSSDFTQPLPADVIVEAAVSAAYIQTALDNVEHSDDNGEIIGAIADDISEIVRMRAAKFFFSDSGDRFARAGRMVSRMLRMPTVKLASAVDESLEHTYAYVIGNKTCNNDTAIMNASAYAYGNASEALEKNGKPIRKIMHKNANLIQLENADMKQLFDAGANASKETR